VERHPYSQRSFVGLDGNQMHENEKDFIFFIGA